MYKRQENINVDHSLVQSRRFTDHELKRVQSRVYLRSWQLRRLSTALFVWSLSGPDSRACSVMAVFVGVIGFAIPVSF